MDLSKIIPKPRPIDMDKLKAEIKAWGFGSDAIDWDKNNISIPTVREAVHLFILCKDDSEIADRKKKALDEWNEIVRQYRPDEQKVLEWVRRHISVIIPSLQLKEIE